MTGALRLADLLIESSSDAHRKKIDRTRNPNASLMNA